MIHIMEYREGLHCAALTVKDNRDVYLAFGWTKWGARRKLLKLLGL